MEDVFGGMDKIIIDDQAGKGVVPYLPLDMINKNKTEDVAVWFLIMKLFIKILNKTIYLLLSVIRKAIDLLLSTVSFLFILFIDLCCSGFIVLLWKVKKANS